MPPKRVRIYFRCDHYILQWWKPAAKKNLSDRVNGDLVAAIMRARQIEERLEHFRSSGQGRRRITHRELVERFRADLSRRAEAGEIDPRTVARYGSALEHYLRFAEQPAIESAVPAASQVNREFTLQFSAYLANLEIAPNGHPHTRRRRMASPRYVEDVCRAMFAWAADPERGNLLPDGFRNPFAGKGRRTNEAAQDLFGEPDITLEMADQFLAACDRFQLPLFALLAFYGLRASEPCFLFREHLADGWLRIPCLPGLGYVTKGRRDKRVPLIAPLQTLLKPASDGPDQGVLFLRRDVQEGTETPPLLGASLETLEQQFASRCQQSARSMARDRIQQRDAVLKEAGALTYDHIEHEFRKVARPLHWPANATLKDFRHLFASTLENAGVPEFYRRYLMGQSPGKAAIVTYTHLNELQTHYEDAVRRRFQPLVETVTRRVEELAEA